MKVIWRVVGMKQTSDISFAPDWLALREPADHTARDNALLAKAANLVRPDTAVLDLGSGTGSTVRAFEGAGYDTLKWRLLDNDAGLLERAVQNHPLADGVLCNLSCVEEIPLNGVGLVTASALLDLMSHDWIMALAKRLHSANLPFYAALNYDGLMHWSPAQPNDATVVDFFNVHQQRDKGTGKALGPTSGATTTHIFEGLGFDVFVAKSPWTITPDHAALHTQLLDGIANAASDIDDTIARDWGQTRKAAVAISHAKIGHLDILAVPQA